jgi:2-dehydropantoate 2-reductase
MPDRPARIAVLGPGAIGASMAAVARHAGHEVVLCGRTPHGAIVVEPDDGRAMRLDGPVLTDPAAAPTAPDVVFVAVKAHQVTGAAAWLRALTAGARPPVVVALQNGVEQRDGLAPHVAPGTPIVPSVVWFPAEVVAPGRVRLRERPRITLPDEPAAQTVQGLLAGAPCDLDLAADFTSRAWRKLAINAVSAIMALSGRRAGIFARGDVRALAHALARECLVVGRAEGADLPDAVADELVRQFAAMPPDLGTSILFDREAGRTLEWDARNGVVQRLGRRHGIATPVSDVVVPLLAAASDA